MFFNIYHHHAKHAYQHYIHVICSVLDKTFKAYVQKSDANSNLNSLERCN